MDYYKLGETAGKAWRLGHMEAREVGIENGLLDAKNVIRIPNRQEELNFTVGFMRGVKDVDVDAAQVKPPVYGSTVNYDTVMDYGISEEGVTTIIDAIRDMVSRGSVRIPGNITTDMVIGWLLYEMYH